MTTEHDEAVRLTRIYGELLPHPRNMFVESAVFSKTQLTALIADVRKQAMEECANH